MAKRPIFVPTAQRDNFVEELNSEFEWSPGFALVQKQKNIAALHQSARENHGISPILEVSTKSLEHARMVKKLSRTLCTL